MAIYSLHHSAIGKTTQPRPYTAAAHIRYVMRKRACGRVLSSGIPTKGAAAQRWFRGQEDADRKNARICDKVLLALPRELDLDQRAALVSSFAKRVTEGRAPWLAAFHEGGKDSDNPHCHLVIRDRDPSTGQRVCQMSEKGSTERLRVLWEQFANLALQAAGRKERIDRRTLEAQGIRRRPTIHEGLSARSMASKGRPAISRPINYRNGPGARSRERMVDYRRLDRGRSRPAHNRQIRETEADYWAAIDADRIAREWALDDAAKLEGQAMDWRKKAGDKVDRLNRYIEEFTRDPDRPVKTGRDAPRIWRSEIRPDGTEVSVERPMSPREQQQVSLPEAVYRKSIRPIVQKGLQGLAGTNQAPGKSPSFSGRLANDREGRPADAKSQAKENEATLERWRREREKDRGRGR